MPFLMVLAGLIVVGWLAEGKEGPRGAMVTYTLEPGEGLPIPAGVTTTTSNHRALEGPAYVRAPDAGPETVFVDLGEDGTHSISWS